MQLLTALYDDETTPQWLRQIPVVDILRQTWMHQYYVDNSQVCWRTAAECLGVTKADYLEQIVRDQTQPSITRIEVALLPCNTRQEEETEQLKAEIHDLIDTPHA